MIGEVCVTFFWKGLVSQYAGSALHASNVSMFSFDLRRVVLAAGLHYRYKI